MKDFFGKDIAIGDTVALLEKAGSSSVYIRKGTVVGFTAKKVKVKYIPQGVNIETESTREPNNLIKS
jgi:hypothetical protein